MGHLAARLNLLNKAAQRPRYAAAPEEAQPADRNTGGGKYSFRILLETSASCGAPGIYIGDSPQRNPKGCKESRRWSESAETTGNAVGEIDLRASVRSLCLCGECFFE